MARSACGLVVAVAAIGNSITLDIDKGDCHRALLRRLPEA
jgi:hypothetical protein